MNTGKNRKKVLIVGRMPDAGIEVLKKRYARPPLLTGFLEYDPMTLRPIRFYEDPKGNIALWTQVIDDHIAKDRRFEIGIDISGHHSKHLDAFTTRPVETVITVCGNADQVCPVFPGQLNRHHWPFDDPAHASGTDEEKLAVFRRVRDEIRRAFTAYADGRRDQLKRAAGS